jgi:hypothetical protein
METTESSSARTKETAQKELQQQHNSSKPNLRSSLIQDQAEKPFNEYSKLKNKIKGIREL